jgi:tryptophan halogenase
MQIPNTLKERMNIYMENARLYRHDNELFGDASWFAVMHGQNMHPQRFHPNANIMPDAELDKRMSEIHKTWAACLDTLPTHQEYIDQHCKSNI